MTGVIPREEVEAVNVDETGFPKPNICMSKVNKYVQFKVKDVDSRNNFILSRKAVGEEALNWITNDLQEGMVVNGIVKIKLLSLSNGSKISKNARKKNRK